MPLTLILLRIMFNFLEVYRLLTGDGYRISGHPARDRLYSRSLGFSPQFRQTVSYSLSEIAPVWSMP